MNEICHLNQINCISGLLLLKNKTYNYETYIIFIDSSSYCYR